MKLRTAAKVALVAASAYALAWGLVYVAPDRSGVFFGWDATGASWTDYPNIPLRGFFPDPGQDAGPLLPLVVGLTGLLGLIVSLVWILPDVRARLRRREEPN